MVSDNKATVFAELRTCLSRFKVVVECHGLDLDAHGARLLKYCCLNEDHQTFMKENFFVPDSVSANLVYCQRCFP
jgi:hypothetical protein